MSKESFRNFFTSIPPSWRFAVVAFVILRGFYGLWSFVVMTIYPLAVQNFDLDQLPIVSIFSLQTSQRHIYLRNVDGQVLTFRPVREAAIMDKQTGSIWNVETGTAIQGVFAGKSLKSEPGMVEQVFPYRGVKPYSTAWLAIWQRFDANWYLSIAEYGYGTSPGDFHFPPLFLFLIQIVASLTSDFFAAGLLISHLATLLTIKLLYDLFHEWIPTQLAKRSILYFLISPASFFLFSVYSEPIFLVFVILSMQAMKKKSWIWSGFWIFCAILTRLQAIALIPAMLYLIHKDQPFLKKTAHWAALIFPVAAGLIYMFMRLRGGEKYVLPTRETELHTYLALPWESYWYALHTIASDHAAFIDLLNWFIATLFILMLVIGWRKLPIEYTLYAAGSLIIMLARIEETQPLSGMSRFALSLFPIFILLGLKGEKPIWNRLIVYPSILLNLYLSAQFWMWGWVA